MTRIFLFTFLVLCILSIIVPLMIPGYIFSLDQALSVNGWIPKIGANIYWVGYLSTFFVYLGIPVWILEKILILITFILPVICGYFFMSSRDIKNSGVLFACLLLIFNPFLYSRFIDGQINIYISYALYPLMFLLLHKAFYNKSTKYTILIAICSLLLCLTSLHNCVFLFFIFTIFGIFHFNKTHFKTFGVLLVSVVLINLLWFIPFLYTKTENTFALSQQIQNFGESNRVAFQTTSPESNLAMSILSMNGYWGESETRFRGFTTINPDWKNIFYIIFFIVLIGIFSESNFKQKKLGLNRYEYSLLMIMSVAFILAHGNQGNHIFVGINTLMYNHFPLYEGMREPQKWVMFLIIGYSYFGAKGIHYISKITKEFEVQKHIRNTLIGFLTILPIIYIPVMFFGLFGQISIQHYPNEWQQAKQYLQTDTPCNRDKCFNTLVFPWHAYMSFQFTGKITGSWVVRYFGDDLLYGDNLEIRGIYTTSVRPESKTIEKHIGPNGTLRSTDAIDKNVAIFIQDIQKIGIIDIMLLKEVDYKFYEDFLETAVTKGYLNVKYENSMLRIYSISNTPSSE